MPVPRRQPHPGERTTRRPRRRAMPPRSRPQSRKLVPAGDQRPDPAHRRALALTTLCQDELDRQNDRRTDPRRPTTAGTVDHDRRSPSPGRSVRLRTGCGRPGRSPGRTRHGRPHRMREPHREDHHRRPEHRPPPDDHQHPPLPTPRRSRPRRRMHLRLPARSPPHHPRLPSRHTHRREPHHPVPVPPPHRRTPPRHAHRPPITTPTPKVLPPAARTCGHQPPEPDPHAIAILRVLHAPTKRGPP